MVDPIGILRDIVPSTSAILQAGGYFEPGSKKDLSKDTATKRRLQEVIEAKNHRLLERMWSDSDLFSSLPQFLKCKGHLTTTDMNRIIKEMGRGPMTKAGFERKIGESYLTAPSRLARIERSEMHITGLVNDQRKARKDKQKYKTWQAGPGACPLCQAMHGQKRKINEPYSNGEYVSHRHPSCLCGETYSIE